MNSRPINIVIVDDEVQITELLEAFISSAGYPSFVTSFNDPVEAGEYVRTHFCDVLISDYKMEPLNGIQLLEMAPDSVKKILISGYVSEITMDRLEALNAEVFEKPVKMGQLKQAIFGEAPSA